MLTRITLISQATTKALRAAVFGGDESLDDIGRRQAESLKGRISRVDRCWISPAIGAHETASALGLNAVVDERLRDCDFGRWKGKKFAQVLMREPRRLMSWISNPS